MRINKYIAQATGLGRRPADALVAQGRVAVNGVTAQSGQDIAAADLVTLDGRALNVSQSQTTLALNKPAGYIVSRKGQGGKTIYELLPPTYHHLKPIGRLDKDSSGLLLLTDDGQLAYELTHPSRQKTKVYEVTLDHPLSPLHRQMISDYGITLDDGQSKLQLDRLHEGDDKQWQVTMHEGRNRQIRRTFAALGYAVPRLHRTQFGSYRLGHLASGAYEIQANGAPAK